MTHEQAMKILDAVRDGADYTRAVIDIALRLTGDLEPEPLMMAYTNVQR
jgi:hypothetical protein